jgi:putative SOS response-associated peptidase YedK
MCGRFTYKLTWPELMRLYRLTLDAPGRNPQPRYNICPTDTIDAVIEQDGKRQLVPMRWGLVPSWWPKPLKDLKAATFNARVETVADKPMFRDAFRRTRCLIPANGYYEWQDTPGGKQPHYFTRRDGQPLTFAGPWLMASAGIELLKPAANDLLQRWPVSKRVNSSRADADDPTLIEPLAGGDPNASGAGLFA